ncbi:hypothetical protein CEXT_752961 [Caerostris extrusa]|uniref:Uncharacterized protein n=1 Tax=Caerostris extrusa TaxID=172846 RepID=A0AAV4TG33_CAEEX|nr:hypothetical protein CEXT_752961 [Caerostris extrusa]
MFEPPPPLKLMPTTKYCFVVRKPRAKERNGSILLTYSSDGNQVVIVSVTQSITKTYQVLFLVFTGEFYLPNRSIECERKWSFLAQNVVSVTFLLI